MNIRYLKSHIDIDGIQRSKGQEVKVLRAYAAELIANNVAEEVSKVRPNAKVESKKKPTAKAKKKGTPKAK